MSQITFEQVFLQFPGTAHPAVDEVSFSIESGEFLVILGPSGCGKTTLLKMVNRLYEPSRGAITLDQVNIRQVPATYLRQQIGYVIQQAGLFPHMTVAENVAVVPRLLGWKKPEIQARVHHLLELVQLSPQEFRHRYPAQLSGGQQQRVGIARALAGDPKILLMDEPFGAIDALTRADLQTELRRLHQTLGRTILFVSHDVEEALRLADRILVMKAGKVIQLGTPLELMTEPAHEFVEQLLKRGDLLRQLRVMSVDHGLEPLPAGLDLSTPIPRLEADSSLRDALTLMLDRGSDLVIVQASDGEPGDAGQPLGVVTLKRLRTIAAHTR
ncbi:MAG: ABC transporter ATP-binding protein [Prochlorotrichaceae cyanobacterium]